MAADIWDRLEVERMAALEYFETLTEEQWELPSMCGDWTNRQVLAHLVEGGNSTVGRFVKDLVRARFDVAAVNAAGVARRAEAASAADLLSGWSAVVGQHTQPNGQMVVEAIVHAEDIRFSVGRGRIDHDQEALEFAAEFVARSRMPLGGRQRTRGLRFVASDAPWVFGSGPTVEGPLLSLIMASAGRQAGLVRLYGGGVEEYAERF